MVVVQTLERLLIYVLLNTFALVAQLLWRQGSIRSARHLVSGRFESEALIFMTPRSIRTSKSVGSTEKCG